MSKNFNSDTYRKTLEFATKAHGSQKTPFGYPYIFHVVSVASIVLEACIKENVTSVNEATSAALLHDTIEDTPTTYEELKREFGEEIANAVLALTLDKSLPTKSEQIKDSVRRIKMQPKWVWMVKLSDRINNLGTPPKHWDNEKKQKYLYDAKEIYNGLYEASEVLASKLAEKINEYKKYM
jgi:guanosine-3',5'-bis(diphosphate) 3'-pyrophosphohydrolase